MDDKAVFRIYEGLEKARAQHEKHIKFGGDAAWCDVEADEVDLAKNIVGTSNIAVWEQWGGLVQRGRPDSLSLFRLKPKRTDQPSRLEAYCRQGLEEQTGDLAHRWCTGLQNANPWGSALQRRPQEEEDPAGW